MLHPVVLPLLAGLWQQLSTRYSSDLLGRPACAVLKLSAAGQQSQSLCKRFTSLDGLHVKSLFQSYVCHACACMGHHVGSQWGQHFQRRKGLVTQELA